MNVFGGGAGSLPRALLAAAFCFCAGPPAWSHALPTPAPQGPLRASGNLLIDGTGQRILLRGVVLPGLDRAEPDLSGMKAAAFTVLRFRWNMNAVRLPVSVPLWRRDGQLYLDQVDSIVRLANAEGLVVILAAREDRAAGAAADLGLPTPQVADFWRAWAAYRHDDCSRARTLVEGIVSTARTHNLATSLAHSLLTYARSELALGDVEGACQSILEGLELEVSIRDGWGIALGLDAAAFVAARRGRVEEAAKLLGATAAHRERLAVALARHFRLVHTEVSVEVPLP